MQLKRPLHSDEEDLQSNAAESPVLGTVYVNRTPVVPEGSKGVKVCWVSIIFS